MIKVLFVDDEPAVLDIAKLFIEKDSKFEVITADSPDLGWQILNSKEVDAVVCDYDMPGRTGLDFLFQVRRAGYNIPFIIFTGRGKEEVVIDAISLGVDYYIQKGGDPKTQFEMIKQKIESTIEDGNNTNKAKYEKTLYHTLFETSNVPIFILNGLDITDMNRMALNCYGCSKKYIGESITLILSEIQPDGEKPEEKLLNYVKKTLSGNPQHFFWSKKLEDDKDLLEVSLSKLPGVFENGRVACIIRETSENSQKSKEKSKDKSEELLSIVDNLPCMIYRCNAMSPEKMEFVSSGSLDLTGFTPDELLSNKSLYCSCISQGQKDQYISRVDKEDGEGCRFSELVYQIKKKGGTLIWVIDRWRKPLGNKTKNQFIDGYIIEKQTNPGSMSTE